MRAWPELSLLEVARLARGTEPGSKSYTDASRGVRFLRVGDITGKADNPIYTSSDELVSVLETDILLVLDGSPGHVSTGHCGAISSGIRKVEPIKRNEVTKAWLRYALMTPSVQQTISRHTTGVTILHASSAVSHIRIPVPPLPEQERIIRILDEADKLRGMRAKADQQSSGLLPSLFDSMFGDPLANTKKWLILPLRKLAEKFSDGPFGSNLKSLHYVETGVRVVRLQNIGVGVFLDEDKAYISDSHFNSLIKHQCLPGDVIVGTLGDPNLRACILPDFISQALNKADCVQIRPQKNVATSEYLCWLLNMPSTLQMASGLVMGQTRSRISMGRLSGLLVPVPPLKIQHDFAAHVPEINALKAEQTLSKRRIEDLFQSLLHRAFQGEL
jgi:type I restriction enzyme S subunit